MAESATQGLAAGLEAGAGLALRKNQQQFEQGLAQQQEARAQDEQAIRQTAAQRADLQSQLGAVRDQKTSLGNDIGTRLASNPQGLPADEMANYRQQKKALDDQEGQLLVRQGGAKLTQWASGAEKTGHDLAAGNSDITQLSPKDAYDFVTHHSGQPAENYIDTPNRPSPVGQNFQKIQQGVQNMQQDGGHLLLQGLNAQYGHNLQGLVGKTAGDGVSTVVGAEFAAPVPHPGSPQHLIPTVKLSVKGPHGEIVDQYVPVMDDHGKILAHPDESADATVKHLGLDDIFDHIGADETFYKAINSSPAMQNKILQAVNEGHDADAKEMQGLALQLGGDPAKWQAPQGELLYGSDGKFLGQLAPGQKAQFAPEVLGAATIRAQAQIAAAQINANSRENKPSGPEQELNLIHDYALTHGLSDEDSAKALQQFGVIKTSAAGGAAGRQTIYNARIINAGQQLTSDLENISDFKVGASTGLMGIGANPGHSITSLTKDMLARTVSGQDDQIYRVISGGLGRYISSMEGAGLPGTKAAMDAASSQLVSNPADTNLTRLTAIAQATQIAENALETVKAAPGVTPDQVKAIDYNLQHLRATVPFTVHDVLKLAQSGKKNQTLGDYASRKGLKPPKETPQMDTEPVQGLGATPLAPTSPAQPPASPSGWSITPVQ